MFNHIIKKMLGNIRNLIEHRELLFYLSMKDFKVRYKSAVLGFLWALLMPLSMMVIFTIVFSFIVRIPVENYPVFLLAGLIPWTFLNMSLSTAINSFVDNGNLIKKVKFPRELVPISVVLANLVNFLLSLIVLFLFILLFNIKLTTAIILLPFIIVIQLIFIAGISLILSSLNVQYRDVRYITEVVLML
ncbi:MAG: ABC transporter permease, partial [Candidatus Altiarchaeota archaeon]|nr:ABC transporter permease [Candidatus Altiarchaeota archaeon]